ncbi:DUF2442 domain-containing protein [uncultured Rhodospira sp.]|mgnify:CR=1 FL=1|uniref:DUF2442 domain-containing protein n=1 Tax=uncultured Rhodospira sp. TaxID=1936189 RepID=UPI00260803AE|nr:DUF2442 domain-containing protein [uncultured Rhodospira sp.]
MPVDVIAVRPLPEYCLELDYANGERRRFDMRPLLAMTPWTAIAAPALFKRVRVEHGTVAWPGEIDVAPETLYADSVPMAWAAQTQRRPGSV